MNIVKDMNTPTINIYSDFIVVNIRWRNCEYKTSISHLTDPFASLLGPVYEFNQITDEIKSIGIINDPFLNMRLDSLIMKRNVLIETILAILKETVKSIDFSLMGNPSKKLKLIYETKNAELNGYIEDIENLFNV